MSSLYITDIGSAFLPLDHPSRAIFGGAKKKVRIAVIGGHVTHSTVAGTQWTGLGAVGRCVAHVGMRGGGA